MKELCEIQKSTIYTTSLERPSSCFRLIVGTTNTEQAKIYENTCKWLLRVVQTKLGSNMFDYAKLMTSDNQIDVRIIIGMSRSSYVKHFETTMNSTEIKNELDDTIREIKIRCARALQKLHEHIGDQVKPLVQDDDRIQVSWLDD